MRRNASRDVCLGSASAAILHIRFEFSKVFDNLFQSPLYGTCAKIFYDFNEIEVLIQPCREKQRFPVSIWDFFERFSPRTLTEIWERRTTNMTTYSKVIALN